MEFLDLLKIISNYWNLIIKGLIIDEYLNAHNGISNLDYKILR